MKNLKIHEALCIYTDQLREALEYSVTPMVPTELAPTTPDKTKENENLPNPFFMKRRKEALKGENLPEVPDIKPDVPGQYHPKEWEKHRLVGDQNPQPPKRNLSYKKMVDHINSIQNESDWSNFLKDLTSAPKEIKMHFGKMAQYSHNYDIPKHKVKDIWDAAMGKTSYLTDDPHGDYLRKMAGK